MLPPLHHKTDIQGALGELFVAAKNNHVPILRVFLDVFEHIIIIKAHCIGTTQAKFLPDKKESSRIGSQGKGVKFLLERESTLKNRIKNSKGGF